ncbi:MAG: histidine kinase, partial [Dokdonella sp.]
MSKHFLSVLWIVLLWWTAYALMFATQVMSMGEQQGNGPTWSEALRYSFGGWMTWVPLSLALYALVHFFPIERGRTLRAIVVLLAGVAGVVVVRAVYVLMTNSVFGWYETLPGFGSVLAASVRNNLMMAFSVVGVAHALVFYRQARERKQKVAELETHLANTRLEVLRAQLHPHFLFNALNSVAEMIHQDAELADGMLVSLSALLRDSLSAEKRQLRSLGHELVRPGDV